DLFLYDWHQKGSHQGLHGFTHPAAALRNASQICALTEVEQDIIVKHMWPLTLRKVPKYRKSFVVSSADKICALAEMLQIYRLMRVAKKLNVCCSQA
ncbi:MAG: HD family phosphohydrolase, partial [Clostridiales bacterium]|nr:HD family phosphohydrolase [Clostridiales bacterium]